jgi:hypothetical protein
MNQTYNVTKPKNKNLEIKHPIMKCMWKLKQKEKVVKNLYNVIEYNKYTIEAI